jgi:Ulp1 family protease
MLCAKCFIYVHACLILYNLFLSTVRIWRKEMHLKGCPVHFFSTLFYTRMEDLGPHAVQRWTASKRKNIDVFTKKFIFIPVNEKNVHWSLCVVVNPGAILNNLEELNKAPAAEEVYPCILFFDSLRVHKVQVVAGRIRNWLNLEWKRLGKSKSEQHVDPFKDNSLKIYTPEGE